MNMLRLPAIVRTVCVKDARRASSWLTALWSGTKKEADGSSPETITEPAPQKLPANEYLQQLSQQYFPDHNVQNWKNVPLIDPQVKAKILISMEAQFGKTIPDNQLGKLSTVGDVLSYLQRRRTPAKHQSLFPDIPRGAKLPDNLSLQTNTSTRRSPPRRPFQNYSSQEHSSFPNKLQKEAKKLGKK